MKSITQFASALFILFGLFTAQLYADEAIKAETISVAQANNAVDTGSKKKEEAEPECD